jgi:hypothetical protein
VGLSIHWSLSLPASTPEGDVQAVLAALRNEALALPVAKVSRLVRFTEEDFVRPRPNEGFVLPRLEDAVDVCGRFVRDHLYRESIGLSLEETGTDEYFTVNAPNALPIVAIGFAIIPGEGSEPAAFGLARLRRTHRSARWSWRAFCKTQYASAASDEHFLKCHKSVVAMLDSAARLGFEIDVEDEGDYYTSRDETRLLESVGSMNHLIAGIAGRVSDAYIEAGGDSQSVQAEIFRHPDFERLEMPE